MCGDYQEALVSQERAVFTDDESLSRSMTKLASETSP